MVSYVWGGNTCYDLKEKNIFQCKLLLQKDIVKTHWSKSLKILSLIQINKIILYLAKIKYYNLLVLCIMCMDNTA